MNKIKNEINPVISQRDRFRKNKKLPIKSILLSI